MANAEFRTAIRIEGGDTYGIRVDVDDYGFGDIDFVIESDMGSEAELIGLSRSQVLEIIDLLERGVSFTRR